MASMTPSSSPASNRAVAGRRAFTLVEVLLASSIFVVMAALVLSVVVAQAKLGVSVTNYSDMNEYSRRVLTRFDKDMRMASKVALMNSDEVTVSVVPTVLDWSKNPPSPGAEVTVRYFFWKDGRGVSPEPRGRLRHRA